MSAAACGKKGPPLAPLQVAPKAPSDMQARRLGDRVVIGFKLPTENNIPSTDVDLARVDVYAVSVAKPADAPPTVADVVRHAERVGQIDVRPPPSEEEESAVRKEEPARHKRRQPKPSASSRSGKTREADAKLPAPGDTATIVEELGPSASKLYVPPAPTRIATPAAAILPSPEPEPVWGVPAFAATPAFETVPPPAPAPVRVYIVVPVSRKGRPGSSASVPVTLAPPPPAPSAPTISYTEKAIDLLWTAPAQIKGFNVYEVPPDSTAAVASTAPLNAAPLPLPAYADARLAYGKPRCYSITSVRTVQVYKIESAPSAPACVTPLDTFPPAPPKGLAAVAGPGSTSLIWDANTEPDLAGYVVLRGEAPGGTLQTLTPEPIHETTFKDATARAGVTYVYAVVAVDTAKNVSAQSARVEETAR